MKNFEEKNTKIKSAAEKAARNEGKILPEHLLQEIEPLLREYFIGDFTLNKDAITLAFKNGQKFVIIAKEVS